jgi:hypothetical protein
MTGMNETAAQAYHDQKQEEAEAEYGRTGKEPAENHFGGCWCCCWDCGFDYESVQRGEGRPGQDVE